MKKIVTALVLSAVALTSTGCSQVNQREITATIEDKERVCDGESCRYLIFTDQGTFENTDSLLSGKFDSSDVYGRLKEGRTYTLKVAGYRQGLLSMYPNIIEVVSEQ